MKKAMVKPLHWRYAGESARSTREMKDIRAGGVAAG
jgi:hypothetical protein